MSMTISSSVGSHHGDALKPQLPVLGAELKDGTLKITVSESLSNLKLVVATLKTIESEHPELKIIEVDFSPVHREAQNSPEKALVQVYPILLHLTQWRGNNPELSAQISGLSEAVQNEGGIRNYKNRLEFKCTDCPVSPLKDNSFGTRREKSSSPPSSIDKTFTIQTENKKLLLSFNTSPIEPLDISKAISAISKFDQEIVVNLCEKKMGWNAAIALTTIGLLCEKASGKMKILVSTDSETDKLLKKISEGERHAKNLGEIIRI